MEGLQTAFICGKQRQVFFGMPAVEYVYEKIEVNSFERIGKGEFLTKDVKLIAHFIYAGVMGGAERKDEPLDITFADVYDETERIMFEGDKNKVLEAVSKSFSESNTVKYAMKNNKKKANGKLTGEVLEA